MNVTYAHSTLYICAENEFSLSLSLRCMPWLGDSAFFLPPLSRPAWRPLLLAAWAGPLGRLWSVLHNDGGAVNLKAAHMKPQTWRWCSAAAPGYVIYSLPSSSSIVIVVVCCQPSLLSMPPPIWAPRLKLPLPPHSSQFPQHATACIYCLYVYMSVSEPNFLRICTHTHTITISIDLCLPMPTHSMTCAHPCPPMLFKLRPCIQKLCNVYYPPTPSLGWIGQIKRHTLSLASAQSTS
jgi:hypothetical protein